MDNERITVRLPSRDLYSLDLFIKLGEFSSRSEVIRHAVHDFVKQRISEIVESAEKLKQFQQLNQEIDNLEQYMKK